MLVAARVAQGAGAALLSPGSLAILQATFEPARARARHRHVVRSRRRRLGDRPVPWRLAGRRRVVAVDLPPQRAARRRRRPHRQNPHPRDARPERHGTARLVRCRPRCGLARRVDARPQRTPVDRRDPRHRTDGVLRPRRAATGSARPPRHLPLPRVQRDELRHVAAVWRICRRVLPPRPRPSGIARLHAARSRLGHDADHARHAAALGAGGCAGRAHRPAHSDDRRTTARLSCDCC